MFLQSRKSLIAFVDDDGGNVSVEWTGLSALVILLGIAVLFSVYGTLPAAHEEVFSAARAELVQPDTPSPEPLAELSLDD